MFKTVQIISYMINKGYSKTQILKELFEIVDNGYSELFDLSENEMNSIRKIVENETKLKNALFYARILVDLYRRITCK